MSLSYCRWRIMAIANGLSIKGVSSLLVSLPLLLFLSLSLCLSLWFFFSVCLSVPFLCLSPMFSLLFIIVPTRITLEYSFTHVFSSQANCRKSRYSRDGIMRAGSAVNFVQVFLLSSETTTRYSAKIPLLSMPFYTLDSLRNSPRSVNAPQHFSYPSCRKTFLP